MKRIEERLESLGIVGYLIERNGPRFYVERVRGRVQLIDSTRTSQRAYIDLETYTPHCTTSSDINNRHWCMERNEEVQRKLMPIARYLRMIGVRSNAKGLPYSHQRWVYSRLHQAGIVCHIDSKRIVLDYTTMSGILPVSIKPFVALEAEHDWRKPMQSQREVEDTFDLSQGLRLRIEDAGRMTIPLAQETISEIEPIIGQLKQLITIP
jgi:hypothetical protein